MRGIIGALLIVAWASGVAGAAQQTIAVTLGQAPALSQDAAGVIHVFAHDTLAVPLRIRGGASGQIDVRARMFQVTSGMEMPLGDSANLLVKVEVPANGVLDVPWTLHVPRATREIEVEVRFSARVNAQPAWEPAGRLRLRVYPERLLDPLRALADRRVLRVRDPQGILTRFLADHGVTSIAWEATSSDPLKRPAVNLVVGEREDSLEITQRLASGDVVVVFKEHVETLPMVRTIASGGGFLTIVELNLLDRLETDPRAQKALAEIMEAAQPQPTSGQQEVSDETVRR